MSGVASFERDLTIRAQGCPAEPYLLWDSVWNAAEGCADWALAAPGERGNRGGLAATDPIATSVILALFTDRRCPPDHPLVHLADDGDLRGWWGDAVDLRADLGEAPMGSLLWLLERATASDEMALWARGFAEEALAPLLAAKLFAGVEVDARAYPERAAIALAVDLFGRDGARTHALRFDPLWTARR